MIRPRNSLRSDGECAHFHERLFPINKKILSAKIASSFYFEELFSFVRPPANDWPARRSIYPSVLAGPINFLLACGDMISSGAGGSHTSQASHA
jgi:hypothetical protein